MSELGGNLFITSLNKKQHKTVGFISHLEIKSQYLLPVTAIKLTDFNESCKCASN